MEGLDIGLALMIVKHIGTPGLVYLQTNMVSHNNCLYDSIYVPENVSDPSRYKSKVIDALESKDCIKLGRLGELITKEDAMIFLAKLQHHVKQPVFDNGRSYCFEGIYGGVGELDAELPELTQIGSKKTRKSLNNNRIEKFLEDLQEVLELSDSGSGSQVYALKELLQKQFNGWGHECIFENYGQKPLDSTKCLQRAYDGAFKLLSTFPATQENFEGVYKGLLKKHFDDIIAAAITHKIIYDSDIEDNDNENDDGDNDDSGSESSDGSDIAGAPTYSVAWGS
jgi:hypothetical protein